MRFILVVLALLPACFLEAQNLGGVWRGTLTQETGGCFPIYKLEIQINHIGGGGLSGNSYDYYDQKRFVKHHYNGRFNTLNNRMMLIEDKILEVKIPGDCVPCTKTYDLTYAKANGRESLTGEWKGYDTETRNICPPGKITLYRVPTTDFPVDIEQPDELVKLQNGLQLDQRDKDVVSTLSLDSSKIRIDLYDNAEIDNDTITVFLNNKMLLYKQRLTGKPLTLNLNAFPNTDYELVMYADNLGSIPPNTALMVVTAGAVKKEIRLASSEKKNAAVRFRYTPK